jgi:hypothetical protein
MVAFVAFLKTVLNLTAPDSKFDRVVTAVIAAGKIVTIVVVVGAKALELINAFLAAAK